MSIYRKPSGFLDSNSGANGINLTGGMAVHCTERATERGDTWEMSMFNAARKEWAGIEPVRLKQMAALFLAVGCDWEYEAIAVALNYHDRSGARKAASLALSAARRQVRA